MARVEYKGTPGGSIARRSGAAWEGVTVTHAGNPVYAAATGSTLYGGPLTTNIDGEVPGWLDPGTYTTTNPLSGKSVTFEVGGFAGAGTLDPRVTALEVGSVSVSGTADDTAGINAKFASDGSVNLRAGIYKILGVVDPGYDKDLTGDGPGRVTLQMGPSGQIIRGSTAGLDVKGGKTAGLRIDGNGVNNVAGGALHVFTVGYHHFSDIVVENCVGDGIVIDGAQNSLFETIVSAAHGGHCLVLDYGAGVNHFEKLELALPGTGKNCLLIRQSGTEQNGSQFPATFGPCDNQFDTSLTEFTANNTSTCIRITAGRHNRFRGGGGGPNNATNTGYVVSAELVAPAGVCDATFDNVVLDSSGLGELVDVGNYAQLRFQGACRFYGAKGFRYTAAGLVWIDPRCDFAGVTGTFATQKSGDTPTATFASIVQHGNGHKKAVRTIGATGEPAAWAAGWGDFGGGYFPSQFYRGADGRTVVEGYAKNTSLLSANSTIFALPAGFRPAGSVETFIRPTAGGRVQAEANGLVIWYHEGVNLPANSLVPLTLSFMPV